VVAGKEVEEGESVVPAAGAADVLDVPVLEDAPPPPPSGAATEPTETGTAPEARSFCVAI